MADVTPAKSDIVHDYAAAYVEDGNLILYFGQNRQLDRTGDANVGFWFLQNEVGLDTSKDKGSFDGNHVDGDLLVQSEFTNGGDVSGIRVYKWQSGDIVEVVRQRRRVRRRQARDAQRVRRSSTRARSRRPGRATSRRPTSSRAAST